MEDFILPTPEEMIKYLDIYVHGQEKAKKILSSTVYFHYLKLATGDRIFINKNPNHILLIGPSGVGKTLIVKTISELLKVPFFYCNTASLTGDGYVGDSVMDTLSRLVSRNDFDPNKINRAIIFFDEFDKIAHANRNGELDVSGEMVQQELLSVLDGNILSGSLRDVTRRNFIVDTSQILVIAAGAFDGIDKIAKKRKRNISNIGFSIKNSKSNKFQEIDSGITSEDIIEYGFLPELVGRFQNISVLNPLNKDDIKSILKNENQTVLNLRKKIYEMHGIELVLTDEAINVIAQRAISSKLGVRGVAQYINKVLQEIDHLIPTLSEKGCQKIILNEALFLKKGKLKVVYNQQSDANQACVVNEYRKSVFSKLKTKKDVVDQKKDDTKNKNDNNAEMVDDELFKVKKDEIKYNVASNSAKKWFDVFIEENKDNKEIINKFFDELIKYKLSLSNFFDAYIWSNTQNIQGNIYYTNYRENKKKQPDLSKSQYKDIILTDEMKKTINYNNRNLNDKIIFDMLCQNFMCKHKNISELLELMKSKNLDMSTFSVYANLANSWDCASVFDYIDYLNFRCQDFTDDIINILNGTSPVDTQELSVQNCALIMFKLAQDIFIKKIFSYENLNLKNKYDTYSKNMKYGDFTCDDLKEISAYPVNFNIEYKWKVNDFFNQMNIWCKALAYSFEYNSYYVLQQVAAYLGLSLYNHIMSDHSINFTEVCKNLSLSQGYRVDYPTIFSYLITSALKYVNESEKGQIKKFLFENVNDEKLTVNLKYFSQLY